MNLLRSLAKVGLLVAVVFGTSAVRAAPTGTLTVDGPRAVAVDGRIELVAESSSSGGSWAWLLVPQGARTRPSSLVDDRVRLTARGRHAVIEGLRVSTRPDDVVVRVEHRQGGIVQRTTVALTVVTGSATAYRPQHGAGYFPHTRTAVPDDQEEDPALGPGIRRDGGSDVDPSGEDDLIEVELASSFAPLDVELRRSSSSLRVWTTRTRNAGTELTFSGDRSEAISLPPAGATVWVEWQGAHGTARLDLRPAGSLGTRGALDRLRFHTFRSIVLSLGGEDQVPSVPVDPNHGAFVFGVDLYERGYDVHLYDEDNVSSSGSGAVYTEVVNALQQRGVTEVVSFGYSHGGGSTWDLVDRLDANRASLPTFSVPYTGYQDGVENDSDIDLDQERKFPPSSAFHVNHYQRGSFSDFFLDGGPVSGAFPVTDGLDVETTPWGAGATHFLVDDYAEVLGTMRDFFLPRVSR